MSKRAGVRCTRRSLGHIATLGVALLVGGCGDPFTAPAADNASEGLETTPLQVEETLVVFGPETFVRASGRPVTEVRTLAVDVSQYEQPFTLRIENGTGGQNRVSDAVVELDDTTLFDQQDFSQQVGDLSTPVTLASGSELRVTIRSKPGSELTISIEGVSTATRWTVLETAGFFACGVTTAARVYCWGSNDSGQLGNGTFESSNVPVEVMGIQDVVAISATRTHACSLSGDGAMHCWGENANGQLGDGTTTDRGIPVPAQATLSFEQIAVGAEHTCARATDQLTYCWGLNTFGQLGSGSNSPSLAPVPTAGGRQFVDISAGHNTSCGVTSSGDAYCWGYGPFGQIGNGSNSNRNVPTQVSSSAPLADISTGIWAVCATETTGTAYCWGLGRDGQLGIGPTPFSQSVPVAVAGGLAFGDVSQGGDHACGVTTAGVAYCWGGNVGGALGDGTSINRPVPTAVATSLLFDRIQVDGQTSCALTANGEAYCWGRNDVGQLGNGTTLNAPTPTQVLDPL